MKLAYGMVGGGNGAFIGDVHRHGAEFDNLALLKAGCFTRNWENNLETAAAWNLTDTGRVYRDYQEMAQKEGAREDGIDFVIIATPNDTHYPIAKAFMAQGIHIMSDKPLTLTVAEAEELAAMAKEKDILFGVTYTYTGYAMVRQIREMVQAGELGDIVQVRGVYPQEWLAVSLVAEHSEQATWRMDPARSGASGCCADIGTHVEALIHAATGLEPREVLARFTTTPADLPLENDVQILLRYAGGVPGTIWASQTALGHETEIGVEVIGTKGAAAWSHLDPGTLQVTKINQPVQTYTAGREYLYPAAKAMSRLPSGHPEGYYEAFGNLYRGYCTQLLHQKYGQPAGPIRFPTVEDGVRGMKFIHACIKSNAANNSWVKV